MEIRTEDVEWAVVYRLAGMLKSAADQPYNVTSTYALFSTIAGWVRQRVGHYTSFEEWPGSLGQLRQSIYQQPWNLPDGTAQGLTRVQLHRRPDGAPRGYGVKEIDLAQCTAWEFFVWIRNAMAHGDGRSVVPLHTPQSHGSVTQILSGFEFAKDGCVVRLAEADMRYLGIILADVFCRTFATNLLHEEIERFVVEHAHLNRDVARPSEPMLT
jgi:hypothetical protein